MIEDSRTCSLCEEQCSISLTEAQNGTQGCQRCHLVDLAWPAVSLRWSCAEYDYIFLHLLSYSVHRVAVQHAHLCAIVTVTLSSTQCLCIYWIFSGPKLLFIKKRSCPLTHLLIRQKILIQQHVLNIHSSLSFPLGTCCGAGHLLLCLGTKFCKFFFFF